MQFSKRENYSEAKQWKSSASQLEFHIEFGVGAFICVCDESGVWSLEPKAHSLGSTDRDGAWGIRVGVVVVGPDFNFNLNENKLWSLCIYVFCACGRRSFSLFASLMLRDFWVYLTTQMDGLHGTCRMDAVPDTKCTRNCIAKKETRDRERVRSRGDGPLISAESANWFILKDGYMIFYGLLVKLWRSLIIRAQGIHIRIAYMENHLIWFFTSVFPSKARIMITICLFPGTFCRYSKWLIPDLSETHSLWPPKHPEFVGH